MKNKLLLATLALPLAFGACTNDDFETASQPQGANGELVEVGPGFAISASKGGSEAATRGQWIGAQNGAKEFLNYAWWPNYVYNEGTLSYDAVRDEIGLCWVGQSVGTNVYTNYYFQHAGWLNEDETTAEISPCEPYNIENGYELENNLSWKDKDRYKLNDGGMLSVNALDLLTGKYKAEGNQYLATIGGQSRNLNSAFFRTPSETLFKGDYIAYLPFTPEMTEAGAVLAHSPKDVTVVLDETADGNKQLKYAHLGSDMFMYAYAPGLVGGTQASNFSFKHLSGLIQIKAEADFSTWENAGATPNLEGCTGITSVTLVDAAGKFVTEVGLDASKIVAEGNGLSTGAALYVPGTEKYTNMLTAHIDNDNSKVENTGLTGKTGEVTIYIPALPTTTGQLSIVLYNHDLKKSAVYYLNVPSIEVKPGQVTSIDIGKIDIEDFNSTVVTTEKALYQLTNSIDGTAENGETITLLGDIELGTYKAEEWTMNKNVTIQGGKIIVPANFEWSIKSDATINSAIEIENRGCCEKKNGLLKIGTNRSSQKLALNGTIDNYGDIVINAGSGTTTASKNVITIAGKLNNHATLVQETGKTNYATIKQNKLTEVKLEGTLVNDGEIELEGTGIRDNDATLYLTKSTSSITNNYYFSNYGSVNNREGKFANTQSGWFYDRIGSQLTRNQLTSQEGEYVSEVNAQDRLETALEQRPSTRVRFINNDGFGNGKDVVKEYDLTDIDRTDVDFEIALTNEANATGQIITFTSESGVVIGDLIVTSGRLLVEKFYDPEDKDKTMLTLNVNNIKVDNKEARYAYFQTNVNATGNVEINQMFAHWDNMSTFNVQFGGAKNDKGVFEKTNVKVGGNFIIGSTEEEAQKAYVQFLSNNITDIKGFVSLYENGNCDIINTSYGNKDNSPALVYATSVNVEEGVWNNSSEPITNGNHPLWDAE